MWNVKVTVIPIRVGDIRIILKEIFWTGDAGKELRLSKLHHCLDWQKYLNEFWSTQVSLDPDPLPLDIGFKYEHAGRWTRKRMRI